MINKKRYTLKEVASLFMVSESSVRHWCNNDGLDCYRTVGGHRRFRSEQIRAYMESKGIKETDLNFDDLENGD